MIKEYFFLAFGNLRHRGLRSWLTILGILIGIAAVVSLISMGQGLQTAITGQFGSLSVDTLTIQNKGTGFGPPGSTVIKKLNDHDVDLIESVSGVDLVVTRIIRVVSIEYNGISGFGYIGDIPNDNEKKDFVYNSFSFKAEEGRLLDGNDRGKILLGNNFLNNNDFGKDFAVGKKVKINGKSFEVVGILEQSSTFQLNSAIFTTTEDIKDLLGINNEYDLIVAQVKDKNQIQTVSDEIERKLMNDRHEKEGEETFSVQTPIQSLQSVNVILNIINLIVVGIAAISLIVGGIGIANTMYTSVLERTKEIGIMKAIGAKNRDILSIFLIESGLLGLVGGIVGALIGLGGAFFASGLANQAIGSDLFKVSISYPLIFGSVAFSFFVGVMSGIFPAVQASKLNVVDALRK